MNLFGIICGVIGDGLLIYFFGRWLHARNERRLSDIADYRITLARRLGQT